VDSDLVASRVRKSGGSPPILHTPSVTKEALEVALQKRPTIGRQR
jgi:hypothetical protein